MGTSETRLTPAQRERIDRIHAARSLRPQLAPDDGKLEMSNVVRGLVFLLGGFVAGIVLGWVLDQVLERLGVL